MPSSFKVDDKNTTVNLVEGPDGPLLIFVYDPKTKTPWLYLRSYAEVQYPGVMLAAQVKNSAGNWCDSVIVNLGLIDKTAGKEQGNVDFVFPVDGVWCNLSMVGVYTDPDGVKQPPGFLCWPQNLFSIGGPNNKFKDIYIGRT